MTCLANDIGYDKIFSEQIKSKGSKGDLLIVLSGSGNSKNIISAIKEAHKLKMNTFGILGFNGGKCKKILNNFINYKINDMQIFRRSTNDYNEYMCQKFNEKKLV